VYAITLRFAVIPPYRPSLYSKGLETPFPRQIKDDWVCSSGSVDYEDGGQVAPLCANSFGGVSPSHVSPLADTAVTLVE
jgi:hypothetical protein